MRQRADELVDLISRQRAIDPAVPLGQFRVIVLCAQHYFECAASAHETREVLSSAGARNHAKRRFELTEDRRLACRKAHVAREYEFASHAAYSAFDLRDGDEPAGAQVAKHLAD